MSWTTLQQRTGLGTLKLAQLLGISPRQAWRLKAGQTPDGPTSDLIARYCRLEADELATLTTLLTRKEGTK